MRQQTLAATAEGSFEEYRTPTRREIYLAEMDRIVPSRRLVALLERHYPKAGNGHHPVGVKRMLRLYFHQQRFNLSDAAVDETTLCRLRHLLEKHMGDAMLDTADYQLGERGIQITAGTIVHATIIHAPSSTENKSAQGDPEIHPMEKSNQLYFWIKAHVGMESQSKPVHSVVTSAASLTDKHRLPGLLHGEDRKVWGDGTYQGQSQTIHEAAPMAQDMTHRRAKFKNYVDELQKKKNTTTSRVRAGVEHVFRVLKRQFVFDLARYRGLAKNNNRLCACLLGSISTITATSYWGRGCSVSRRPGNGLQRSEIEQRRHLFYHVLTYAACRPPLAQRRRQINHLCRGSLGNTFSVCTMSYHWEAAFQERDAT